MVLKRLYENCVPSHWEYSRVLTVYDMWVRVYLIKYKYWKIRINTKRAERESETLDIECVYVQSHFAQCTAYNQLISYKIIHLDWLIGCLKTENEKWRKCKERWTHSIENERKFENFEDNKISYDGTLICHKSGQKLIRLALRVK